MVIGKGPLTTSPGSRNRVGCPLLIAWSSLALILCLCGSCTVPILAGGADSVGNLVAGYSHLHVIPSLWVNWRIPRNSILTYLRSPF